MILDCSLLPSLKSACQLIALATSAITTWLQHYHWQLVCLLSRHDDYRASPFPFRECTARRRLLRVPLVPVSQWLWISTGLSKIRQLRNEAHSFALLLNDKVSAHSNTNHIPCPRFLAPFTYTRSCRSYGRSTLMIETRDLQMAIDSILVVSSPLVQCSSS
jgi:hypothetical protein